MTLEQSTNKKVGIIKPINKDLKAVSEAKNIKTNINKKVEEKKKIVATKIEKEPIKIEDVADIEVPDNIVEERQNFKDIEIDDPSSFFLAEKQECSDESAKLVTKTIKKKSDKSFDKDRHQILSIGFPQKNNNAKMKKKYWLDILYMKDGKKRKRRINFGKKGIEDYIDHLDPNRRENMISRMKQYDGPFKQNFYRLKLLNREQKIQDAYMNLLKEFNLA